MKKSFKCGAQTISFDDKKCKDYTFTCSCTKKNCHFDLSCGEKGIISGNVPPARKGNGGGTVKLPPDVYSVAIRGKLNAIANSLERLWGRALVVPSKRRDERVSTRVKGTPEEIVEKLRLHFR